MPIPELKTPSPYNESLRKSSKKHRGSKIKTIFTFLMVSGLLLGLAGVLAFTILMAWISRDLPNPNTLLAREIPQSTKIYDRTGDVLLYEIHGDEKRTLATIDKIPDYVKWATIAIEDKGFYEHHGVYWKGLLRAFTIGFLRNQRVEGTSTLTQQLVKNAILTNERTITRKLKELLLSIQIERKYEKDHILQLYLNEIPYGSNLYGIESAAEGYFGKTVSDLTLDESALLASLPQSPDTYNPYGTGSRGDNRELLVARQHTVLDAMANQGYITTEEADAAKQIDTLAKLKAQTVSDIKAPHYVMYVKSQLIETYGQKMVEQGGLRVITTLDWDMQQIAEEEVVKGVDKNGDTYGYTNSSLVALDPKNGQILSMVGSKDFWDPKIDGQVNVALRDRQPGSSFKPMVYTAGFIKGYTTETVLWDVLTTFKTEVGPYTPQNYSNKYRGPTTVRSALQGSLNIPAVKMLYLVGLNRFLDFAEQLGYTTLSDRSRFGLSLVLGGGEVKLIEHANAYAAFANKGIQFPTTSILKVTDPNGEILEEWQQPDGNQVVPEDAALKITNILSDNNARAYVFGTNNPLTLPDRQVAAKTGTTNNNNDAWTMGYTPNLVAGVWCGNSNGDEMKRGADGSVIAAPVWQSFMKRATANMEKESFSQPPSIESTKSVLTGKSFKKTIKIDKVSGKIATEYTPEEFIEEQEFYEGHNILWYLDKDDPLGPAPSSPQNDPQFANWELAVQKWIEKENWHTTSTAPTEYDDVHTPESKPSLTVFAPTQNANLYSRDLTISLSAQAQRRIVRIEVKMDDILIGQSLGAVGTINTNIPNTIKRGYHDLTIKAIDDVGNSDTQTITINLMAELAKIKSNITSPADGTQISQQSFPIPISVQINDLEDVQKIDLRYTQNGTTYLIGSIITPNEYTNQITWNKIPELGDVTIYPVVYRKDSGSSDGDKIQIRINP
ncbi:PBP1A family penicillin-binding protein [Patescibacteria group bacterium]|nr:PBP1A family penicillin-binding protein [Patescibacteria group bacterium]